MSRMLLLNPGPITLSDRVRRALLNPDLCHREADYRDLQRDVQMRLAHVYPASAAHYRPILISGSGTAAVEAMIGSLVPKNGRVLVIANGVYGERMADMLARHGKEHVVLKGSWTTPLDLNEIERALSAGKAFTHAAIVHHETTTGRLNPIADVAALCKKHNVNLLLDAVSSFGAEDIDFANWNIEGCAATANKCLHGVPGIAFVVTRTTAFERASGATSLYLDLHKYAQGWDKGEPPFTPAIQSLYALQEALREFEEAGGQAQRQAQYRALAGKVMAGLQRLGISTFLAADASSCVLTAYHLPKGVTYDSLHDRLKETGFVIYAGQGNLSSEMFRISTMGDLHDADMDRLLAAIAAVCPA